jgi:hypothetical protein
MNNNFFSTIDRARRLSVILSLIHSPTTITLYAPRA